jgi:hypothetical protein
VATRVSPTRKTVFATVTTVQQYFEKIIAGELWLQPFVAKAQFRDLFRPPNRPQATVFLLASELPLLA